MYLRKYLNHFTFGKRHTEQISNLKIFFIRLKSSEKIFKLVCGMVDTWYRLVNTEQSVLVEAIEQLRVDNNVATSCIKALTEATDKLKSSLTYSQIHALILVNHRFLSLYST